ncbi:MAG: hypothetical protein DCC71_21640, partial [Proteobacteria bacterium]
MEALGARDRDAADAPIDAAVGTRQAEAGLRNVAAVALLVLAARAEPIAALALVAVAIACALGRAPRAASAAVVFAAAWSSASHRSAEAALLLA